MKVWKSHGSKLLYKNPFMDFYEYQVERPDGKTYPYYCVKKSPSCIIIPIDGESTFVIGQYRFAAKSVSWEFPGGGADTKSPINAAKRELKEETGLIAKELRLIGSFFINTGYSNQKCYAYVALRLTQDKLEHESTEFLEVKKVKIEEFEAMIKKGKVIDSASISTYYLYLASKSQHPS